MKLGTFLYNYLHPYRLIDEVSTAVWPYAEPFLDDMTWESFQLLEKLLNLAAIVLIYYGFQILDWLLFIHLVLLLGVWKQIFLMQGAKLSEARTRDPAKPDRRKAEGKADAGERHHFGSRKDNRDGVTFDADRVEDFCLNNLKPSLDWLNKIVRTVWLNFRAFAKFKVLHELWPKAKRKLMHTPLRELEIHDFNIGDKPMRIMSIKCVDYSAKHMIVDVEIAYDGNANITITYSHKGLNISIPVTLQKISVSNVKVRVVLKNLKNTIPLVEGIQFCFLESPVIDWETADAAKVVDLPGLDRTIKSIIDEQIVQRFVLPNRLSIPLQVPDKWKKKLADLGLAVEDPNDASVAMPDPEGVVRVTAVRAENLRPTDLGFAHYAKSKNLNPCKPNRFSCSELLPKRSSGDPYVTVSVGKESYQSEVVNRDLNPEWNFTCEFVVEYYHKALVKLDIYDKDISLGCVISDDLLGRVTEKISRIRSKRVIEGWYNCQIYQGRVHLKFQWIRLAQTLPPGGPDERPGALCLYLGILHAKEPMRPTIYVDIMRLDDKLLQKKSLDAVANDLSWNFNEGKVFRIKNLNDHDLVLQVRVYDSKCDEFVGQRKFKIRGILEDGLDGYYKIHNPFETSSVRSVALSLCTKIVYDQIDEGPAKSVPGRGPASSSPPASARSSK